MDTPDYSPLATDDGFFTIAALDHRDALASELESAGQGVGPEALSGFKRDLVIALADRPSAVMLEPEYALPDLASLVPEGVGITCALESQGYFSDPDAGNSLMDGWGPSRVASVGAHCAKLLVLYRHDRGTFTADQEKLVASVVEDASKAGVPMLIEPVPVEVVDDADRAEVIIQSARRLGPLGPMILKLPFPGEGRTDELDEAVGAHPWTLLSWGVGFDQFAAQLAQACASGCSGFTVGRALWREAIEPSTRAEFTSTTLVERFNQLAEIARTGRPWHDRG